MMDKALYIRKLTTRSSSRLGMRLPNGDKNYELTNHLGNVLAVVSDTKNADGTAKIVSASDYYPFGMQMPSRTYNSTDYRYSFNSQEKTPELNPSHTTALFWEYDGRLGRRWNIDPVDQVSISNYATFANNPILNIDPDGKKFDEANEKKASKMETSIDKQINKIEKKGGEDATERIAELLQSKEDISDMRNSETYFRFEKTNHKDNSVKNHLDKGLPITSRTKENEITMFMNKNNLHEPRHGGQIARGEFDVSTDGIVSGNYTYETEISAYRAEYSFDKKLTYVPLIDTNNEQVIRLLGDPTTNIKKEFGVKITNIREINKDMLKNMYDTWGIIQHPIYLDYPKSFWKE